MSSIPTKYKEACYYLGLNPDHIVDLQRLSPEDLASKGYDSLAMAWRVSLRNGDLHWSGIIVAPPYSVRPPVTHIEDLINNTRDCPNCKGSGKVPQ